MKLATLGRRLIVAAIVLGALASRAAAQENIALQGTATQSSNWGGPAQDIFPAKNAIDGNFANFQHTGADQWPGWWEVDLGDLYDVSFIVLYNRGDGCCQSRHRDLQVEIKDYSGEGETVLYKSPLLNPENLLGAGGTAGPKSLTLDLAALTGAPVPGGVVRVTRLTDFDFSGTGGQGNWGEPYLLQLGEVEVYTGECQPGAGICSAIAVEGPPSGGPGLYTVTATAGSTPPFYTYIADNGKDPPLVVGPLEENVAPLLLTPGDWTISVRVGDNRLCPSEAPEALCSQQVLVKDCTADPQDTRCDVLAVQAPHGGPFPGTYVAGALATDDSGDEPVYTFSASNGVDPPTVIGPQNAAMAAFNLAAGSWTVSVAVGDNRFCPPDAAPAARCAQVIEVRTLSDKPNVAPGGTTSQSSGYNGGGEGQFPSSLAIDGNLNNFTHTASADAAASWQVDLGDLYAIEAIQIHNRGDCCQYRLRDLTVTILDLDGQAAWTSEILNADNIHPDGSGNPYSPPRLTLSLLDLAGKAIDGKVVRIQRAPDDDGSGVGTGASMDDMNVLSLGEVEVFGAPTALPASVVRELAQDTFHGTAPVSVSLNITAQVPDTPVAVSEVLPDGGVASAISDGGAVVGGAIEWVLGGVASKVLTYEVAASSSCAGTLRYAGSTFTAAGKKGLVRGESRLMRTLEDRSLGAWQSLDIATTGGAAEPLADHDLLVSAPGQGIKGQSDEFRLVAVAQNGDFELSARIDCRDDPGGLAQAGLMIRDTLDPHSAHVFFSLSGVPPTGGGVGTLRGLFRRETNPARLTSNITISQKDVAALPIHLKLKRAGSKITFERSADGTAWQEVAARDIGTGSVQVNLRPETLAGLAATAGGGQAARFTFGGVSGPAFSQVPPQKSFRRGDVNMDGKIDVTDPVKLLGFLFLGQSKPECLDAGDTDDSGLADISDAVSNLGYQFLGAAPPAEPGPTRCGPDSSLEDPDLGCDSPCA